MCTYVVYIQLLKSYNYPDAGAPTLTPPVSPANTQPQPKATPRKRALEAGKHYFDSTYMQCSTEVVNNSYLLVVIFS